MSGKSSIPRPIPAETPSSLQFFMATMRANARKVAGQNRARAEVCALLYTRRRLAERHPRVRPAVRRATTEVTS